MAMKKSNMYGEKPADDFEYDPEAEDNTKKYRLPFALCKANGIPTQDWWTPKDAWEALKNGGIVDDVDDEYKDYYRKLKRESAKKSYERRKLKTDQLRDPEHNPDKNYQHQTGRIAGVEKGKPMSFEEADNGKVNPNFGTGVGYRHNCQTCVATYVARRQGYDVHALPNLNNKNIYNLSRRTNLAYYDANGNHPEYIPKPYYESVDTFMDRTIKQGDIYSVEFTYVGRTSGHIITVERGEDGNIRLYDPQTNETVKKDYIRQYFSRTKNIKLMNLTNCTMNEEFADSIMKK